MNRFSVGSLSDGEVRMQALLRWEDEGGALAPDRDHFDRLASSWRTHGPRPGGALPYQPQSPARHAN